MPSSQVIKEGGAELVVVVVVVVVVVDGILVEVLVVEGKRDVGVMGLDECGRDE